MKAVYFDKETCLQRVRHRQSNHRVCSKEEFCVVPLHQNRLHLLKERRVLRADRVESHQPVNGHGTLSQRLQNAAHAKREVLHVGREAPGRIRTRRRRRVDPRGAGGGAGVASTHGAGRHVSFGFQKQKLVKKKL